MKEVKIDCACPPDGARHPDGDTVNLRETLGFRSVTAIRTHIAMLEDRSDFGEVYGVLTEGYVRYGIESWTLRDEQGEPLPVTRQQIEDRILARLEVAMVVGDEADELYAKSVMLPLAGRGGSSSQPTPTEPTSPPSTDSTESSGEIPRPLKPSSTTTTPTDDIEMTSSSPDGASSSSRKSASAA